MPVIRLETFIKAPAALCFDLARDIDLHTTNDSPFKHRAVAGVTSGLIALNETVTWEAGFFGVSQRMTSKIVAFEPPRTFTDEMLRGPFKRWRHTHLFEPQRGGTLMSDHIDYASPLGPVGAAFDALYLKGFLTRFIVAHNEDIRRLAERRAQATPAQVAPAGAESGSDDSDTSKRNV
ncbi:MAG TPA: SRPBCC family protein [Pyrinomonadaceae bacterium]|jgi:ligand-binding SRPBCC domain-containing protein|nr:SRPBCC family protein [Pyrinomonadaceae bacterium]